jgi:hypothetical protein
LGAITGWIWGILQIVGVVLFQGHEHFYSYWFPQMNLEHSRGESRANQTRNNLLKHICLELEPNIRIPIYDLHCVLNCVYL